jgi:phenylalanine-4-hydroxylase
MLTLQIDNLEAEFKSWCKKTNRSGGVLVGSSIREFLRHLESLKLSTENINENERIQN